MLTAHNGRKVTTALVVEDDASLATAVGCFLGDRVEEVRVAATKGQALDCLRSTRIDVALVDLALPDGSGLELLEELWSQSAMPNVIVMSGVATPDVAFRLAQAGVRRFLTKPFSLERLTTEWDEVLTCVPDVRPLLRCSVGRVDLKQMEYAVRWSMIEEALALAEKSRRRAAGLLGISRQLLQHILRAREDGTVLPSAPGERTTATTLVEPMVTGWQRIEGGWDGDRDASRPRRL